MKIINKTLKLDRAEYYKKHLLLINQILPVQMTQKESEVLSAFMSLEGDIASNPFGTTGRKIVRERMSISAGGLGNYLKILKEKKFVREDENGRYVILPILIPAKYEQGYQFKLQIDE